MKTTIMLVESILNKRDKLDSQRLYIKLEVYE